MPKIVGFMMIIISVGFFMDGIRDAIIYFTNYGATTKEIFCVIGTSMFGGGFIVGFAWLLWG